MDPYQQQPYGGYATTTPSPMMGMGIPVKTPDELAEERRWEKMDKMMERQMRLNSMAMMSNMMGGNNGNQMQAPPGVAFQTEDITDIHGRPTGAKRQIPVPINSLGQQGGGMDDTMKMMFTAMQQQNTTLLQSLHQPNTLLEKIATTALSSHQNSVDPFAAFGQILEYVNKVNQNRAQPETKSLDVISKEIDAKLALTQLNMQEKKEEREYNREIEGERSSSENMKTYIDSIKDVVTKMLGPAVTSMAQGYLQQPAGQLGPQAQAQQAQAQQAQVQNEEAMIAQQQAMIAQQRQQEYVQAQMRQQEAKIREAQEMAQRRPVDEQIAERTDGQLDQDFAEIDNKRREMERIFQKVAAERAKRRMIRSSGIATRAQQQMQYAPPPSVHDQTFEERIAAGEQAAQEEMGAQIAAGNSTEMDTTAATAGAVETQLTADDLQAMAASKDGVQQPEPMQFGVSGSPTAQPEASTEPPLEEDEEYEDEEEGEAES